MCCRIPAMLVSNSRHLCCRFIPAEECFCYEKFETIMKWAKMAGPLSKFGGNSEQIWSEYLLNTRSHVRFLLELDDRTLTT